MKVRTKDGWYLRINAWDGHDEIPVSDEDFLVWVARAMSAWPLMRGHEIMYNGTHFVVDAIVYDVRNKEISIGLCASNGAKKRC
jgi:hypothetical protein